jgi:hypothetical protein
VKPHHGLFAIITQQQPPGVVNKRLCVCCRCAAVRPGVMLIDRNDELAALHEKGHLQEAQIAAGTMQLSLREDEVSACLRTC